MTLRRIRRKLLAESPVCWYCGWPLSSGRATLDHLRPRSRGGSDDESNLVLACWPCNRNKGDRRVERVACQAKRCGGVLRWYDYGRIRAGLESLVSVPACEAAEASGSAEVGEDSGKFFVFSSGYRSLLPA